MIQFFKHSIIKENCTCKACNDGIIKQVRMPQSVYHQVKMFPMPMPFPKPVVLGDIDLHYMVPRSLSSTCVVWLRSTRTTPTFTYFSATPLLIVTRIESEFHTSKIQPTRVKTCCHCADKYNSPVELDIALKAPDPRPAYSIVLPTSLRGVPCEWLSRCCP